MTRQTNRPQHQQRRHHEARPIAELMPDAGRAAFRRFGFIQANIVTHWADIVGGAYASVSAPEAIRFAHDERTNGVLHLVVAPAYAPIMAHLVPGIIERVNRCFGYHAVARVRIRQGPIRPPPGPQAAPAPPAPCPLPTELHDTLQAVHDLELRAVLESLARSLADADSRS